MAWAEGSDLPLKKATRTKAMNDSMKSFQYKNYKFGPLEVAWRCGEAA